MRSRRKTPAVRSPSARRVRKPKRPFLEDGSDPIFDERDDEIGAGGPSDDKTEGGTVSANGLYHGLMR